MIMAGQILVPFNSHLRVEDIISVIEEAAKPGMRVVFLVRYPVDPWEWFRDHWVTTESSRDAMLAGRKVMERYSLGGAKGVGRRDGCSMASRFAKDGSKGDRGCLYRQFVKRGGKLSSRGRDLSRNAGSSAISTHREFSLVFQLWTYATSRLNALTLRHRYLRY